MKMLKSLGFIAIVTLLSSCAHMGGYGCKSKCDGQCSTKKESPCDKGQCPMSKSGDTTAPTEAPKAP